MATRFIFPVQVGISLLIFTLCIAIIGCAGHVLSVYGDEGDSNMWWLSLWPDHFAAGPTRALIGSAAAVVVMNTIFLALITLPLVSTLVSGVRDNIQNLTVSFISLISGHTLPSAPFSSSSPPSQPHASQWAPSYTFSKKTTEARTLIPFTHGRAGQRMKEETVTLTFHQTCRMRASEGFVLKV